jgi:hypothetical protein
MKAALTGRSAIRKLELVTVSQSAYGGLQIALEAITEVDTRNPRSGSQRFEVCEVRKTSPFLAILFDRYRARRETWQRGSLIVN